MINIAICDDEKKDRELISNIAKHFFEQKKILFCLSCFESGEELLGSNEIFEVIFLDIEMGEMDGVEVGKLYREINMGTKIIYITNFPQYIEKLMNYVHAFACLKKPIDVSELEFQLQQFNEHYDKTIRNKKYIKIDTIKDIVENKIQWKIVNFDTDDIYYFEYMNRKVKICTKLGEYTTIIKMKDLVGELIMDNFYPCHQSFLVNLKYVTGIKGYEIFIHDQAIPLSQKRSVEFRGVLAKFFL